MSQHVARTWAHVFIQIAAMYLDIPHQISKESNSSRVSYYDRGLINEHVGSLVLKIFSSLDDTKDITGFVWVRSGNHFRWDRDIL